MEKSEQIHMHPKLLKAARRGDKRLVEELLPYVATSHEISIAVPAQAEEVSILSEEVTIGGNTALHIAAIHGHLDLTNFICHRESSLLVARNVMLETPLLCAARAGHDKIVSSIIAFTRDSVRIGVEPVLRARNRDGETALHEAVRNGHVKIAEMLVSADRGLANMVDEDGISPLYLAAMVGSVPLLRVLLPPSSTTTATVSFPVCFAGPNGQTALHAAVLLQNSEIAKVLLEWNQMLAKRGDKSGSIPLHYASLAGNDKMVKLLLEHSTSLAYISDSSGSFPLHVAAMMDKVSVIKELIKYCPDSDELLDEKGRNFLHTAVENKSKAIVQYVCEKSELVKLLNAKDYEGNTPLHLAVRSEEQDIVSILMQNKRVNSSIMNREGLTPLDIAIIEVERGLTYYLTPTRWIFLCLIRTGALASPRGLDHFLRDNIAYPVLEKETRNHAHLTRSLAIASAVIATVTFAAAFTMPGGYKADGTPVLAGRYTFKAFVIADTLAFILSILCTYSSTLSGSEVVHPKLRRFHAVWSSKLLVLGTKCMVAAFAFAIYVVLAPVSNGIGIVVYVMTSIMVLMFGTLSMIQLYKLAKTIKSRVGWAGLFKSHVPQQAWNSYNVARTIFQTILEASWIYIFIFLFALL